MLTSMQTIYLVIQDDNQLVDAIFRSPSIANEYKREREQHYAQMTKSPPRFRIDERQLR